MASLTPTAVAELVLIKVGLFKANPKQHDRNTCYGVFMNLEDKNNDPLIDKYDTWEEAISEALDKVYGPRVDLEEGF